MAHRILRLCRTAALAVALTGTLAVLPRESSAVITLTGVNEFSTDANGNSTGEIWDTRGNINTAYRLWMINGGFGGPFINGPTMTNVAVSVPLLRVIRTQRRSPNPRLWCWRDWPACSSGWQLCGG
jgi:hypothetical protein